MTSITDVRGEPRAPWFRWQPEWTLKLMTWVVGGLIAGGSAGLGFAASWQTMRADLSQAKADIVAIRASEAQLAIEHSKLMERQNRDDQIHAAQDATGVAIQKDLDRLYKELIDFRRDLTGRGIR